jgi:hypothetical protein
VVLAAQSVPWKIPSPWWKSTDTTAPLVPDNLTATHVPTGARQLALDRLAVSIRV